MGCLKLTYHPEFLHLVKETAIEKSDHRKNLPLGEKNAGKENCIDYYPFGLTFNSYQSQNFLEQKFTYNGKEKQDELNVDWLDYGARMYMPELGRWGVIDPLTEKYFGESSYSYTFNNPVFFNDPTGMEGNVYGVPSSQFSAGGSVETVYDANSNGLSFNYGGKSYSSMDAVFEANPLLASVEVFQHGKKIGDAISPNVEQVTALWNKILASVSYLETAHEPRKGEANQSEGEELIIEEPVNLFKDDGSVFNQVVKSRKYKLGDGNFTLFAHGESGFILNEKTFEQITNAEDLNSVMSKLNPNWDAAKSKKGTTLAIWACKSATPQSKGNSIAQLVSASFPNIYVIGADGYVNFSRKGGYHVSGIDKKLGSGMNDGAIVVFKGGLEVYRRSY
jgi:RHS repeat-associated protein